MSEGSTTSSCRQFWETPVSLYAVRQNRTTIRRMPWNQFFKEKVIHMLETSKEVLDIGGGLRVDRDKSNRVDPTRAYLLPYLAKVSYKVMDPVDTYHPDV